MWSAIKFAWQFPRLWGIMLELLYQESPLAMDCEGEIQPKHWACFQEYRKEKLYCFGRVQIYMFVIERR